MHNNLPVFILFFCFMWIMCWSGQCVNKSTGDRQADRSEQSHCCAELHTYLAQPQGNTSTCFLCMGVLSYDLLFNFRTLHPVIWLICLFDLFLYSYTYSHHVHYHTFFSSLYTLCLSYHQHHTLYTIHTYTISYIHYYTIFIHIPLVCRPGGRIAPGGWRPSRGLCFEGLFTRNRGGAEQEGASVWGLGGVNYYTLVFWVV